MSKWASLLTSNTSLIDLRGDLPTRRPCHGSHQHPIESIRYRIGQSLAAALLALRHDVRVVVLENHSLQILDAPSRAVQAALGKKPEAGRVGSGVVAAVALHRAPSAEYGLA